MIKSEKKYRKENKRKMEFMKKLNRMDDFIISLKRKIKSTEDQIDTIDKEGLSVTEYSLDKTDVPRLKKENKDLWEIIQDIEILKGYYEIWKKK